MTSHVRNSDFSVEAARFAAARCEALGLSDDEVEFLYIEGVRAYRSARYEDAEVLFKFASMSRPACQKYAYGLGLNLKRAGKYEHALLIFLLRSLYAQSDFKFQLRAVECLLHLQRKPEAIKLLRAMLRNGAPDVDQDLRQRAQTWLQLAEAGEQHASNGN